MVVELCANIKSMILIGDSKNEKILKFYKKGFQKNDIPF